VKKRFRISWVWDKNPNAKNFVNTIKRLVKEKEILSIIDQVTSPTSAKFVATNTVKIIKKICRFRSISVRYLSFE
jgi:dTDP-4-dehydrorhamnose reductase